jgi:oxaloacetate decarboxylase gamma subunit
MNNPDYQLALTLLLVGMLTVAFILILVVLFGNLLIRFVNKYFPEEVKVVTTKSSSTLDSRKVSAIVAAVDVFTRGKGKVNKIEKID